MLRLAGFVLVGCVALMAQDAWATNFWTSLKNFYAEYEVVKACAEESQLSDADAELAKTAIEKIEAHYLKRDASLNKERALQAAIADKDEGIRIATRGGNKSDFGSYCRVSLKELLAKAEEIDETAKN